jgi:hypothetical protein
MAMQVDAPILAEIGLLYLKNKGLETQVQQLAQANSKLSEELEKLKANNGQV